MQRPAAGFQTQLSINRTLPVYAACAALMLLSRPAGAANDPADVEFFESRVRPVLVESCADCHNSDDPESGLSVDSLAGLLQGGTRGPAVIPGKPDESLLVSAMRHGELLKMPPKEKLPARQIADVVRWIAGGAVWPNAEPVTVAPNATAHEEPEFTGEQLSHWAFQPVTRPAPPELDDDWAQSPIDHFVLSQLREAGLHPAVPADRRTLIRRVTFDLHGLPPTPEEVDAFLADDAPDAFARLIDRLLASPHYGQRWGRHWLDVARYAESNGLDENLAYANAYRYRDWVVDAFNRDLPYDQFVIHQIAGDLLETGDANERFDQLTATGFLTLGGKMLAEDDPVKMQMDIIDEQIDTTSRAFMGLTMGCARCHHHKFDPLSTHDYYALAGIFKSTKTMENFSVVARWQERPLATPDQLAELERQQAAIDELQSQIDAVDEEAREELLEESRRHVGDYLLAAVAIEREERILEQAVTIGDDAEAVAQPGVTVIEAEDYDRGNVNKDTTSYGPGIGVLVNRGETPNFVEYEVEVAEEGLYQFELRYAAASSRPCELSINDEIQSDDAAGEVTGTWFPDSQTWFVEAFVWLEEGDNVIRLEHPQFFPHIDKLLLAPAAEELAEIEHEPLDPDFELIPEWLGRWHDAIRGAEEDSLLAVWKRLSDDPATSPAEVLGTAAALIGDPPPETIHDLAGRFEEAALQALEDESFADAHPELQTLLVGDAGPFASDEELQDHYAEQVALQLEQLHEEQEQLESELPEFPQVMAVSDQAAEDVKIHIRGSHLTLGPVVERRFPRAITDEQSSIAEAGSGRLELARWLADEQHPLTARVFVNRIWGWHFGEGLVRSPDNFGLLGEQPTHPELLDWLAAEFVEGGWSIKALHRKILLSSTYQMSTAANPQAEALDPDNRLLWRMNRRRLEAEAIRDSLLVCGGSLNAEMRGSLLPTENRAYVTSTANVDPVAYVTSRRSVYVPVVRSALYDVFQAFDFADPSALSGKRQSTTVAPQALFMMNSKFVSQQSQAMADRLLQAEPEDEPARIELAYRIAYARPPTQAEIDRATGYVREYAYRWQELHPDHEDSDLRAWQSFCRAILSANEFLYVE